MTTFLTSTKNFKIISLESVLECSDPNVRCMSTSILTQEIFTKVNKKVLLRERKRHTARRVVNTPSVVLTGYPPARVPPCRVTPPPGYPPGQGTPWQGTPPAGYPPGRVPPSRVPPLRLDLAGYPPLPHGILGNVAKHYGIWVPPPGVDRLKTLPSPSFGCGR